MIQVTELATVLLCTLVDFRKRFEGKLPHLLLLVAAAEMLVYRLLVPGLRPRVDVEPAWWHSLLTYCGLFLFYFASALAVGVVAHQLWQILRKRDVYKKGLRWVLVVAGYGFLALACLSIVAAPSTGVTFLLEASVVLSILLVLLAQLTRKGDLGARIGLLLLALPLLVHFYGPVSVQWISEEALFNGITDTVESAGRWLVLLSALTMPYCFGARPFVLKAARLLPLVASLVVGGTGVLLVRTDYVKGMELAQNGLGISVGPGAPGSLIALAILAFSAVAWTLASCFTVCSKSRYLIGVGVGLVVVGGYGFAWPLQYLLGLSGLLAISRAATTVGLEERAEQTQRSVTVPAIADQDWQAYIEVLRKALPSDTEDASALTVRGDEGSQRTHLVYGQHDMTITVTIERIDSVVNGLDVRIAPASPDEEADTVGPPVWTLHSCAISKMGLVHPAPPECVGRVYELEDLAERFQILDEGNWSASLLDAELTERLDAEVHGWIACWPAGPLRFQVYPARGAPLNHPIPITALSFQSDAQDTDAMIALLALLVELAGRFHAHSPKN